MSYKSDLIYKIAISRIKGVGDITAKKLISHCGSANLVFKENKKSLESIPNINKRIIELINDPESLKRAEKEIRFMEKNNVNHLFYTDKNYPSNLKLCMDAPVNLFYKGSVNWNNQRFVSIVGTRKCTQFGKEFTENIVSELSKYNVVIVSGLAFGIDIASHKAALNNNMQTVSVLAHGLDRVYPSQHAKYTKEIIENGALLTDYISETKPERQNFPSRNRIVAGLSEATIVVESSKKGGSLITADIANSYNRDVFAVPGKPKNKQSEGCNHLIKSHQAILLDSVTDIVKNLNWDVQEKSDQQTIFTNLSDEDLKLINVLNTESLHVDELKKKLNWDSSKVAKHLLQMEFENLIVSLPGKIYKRRM
ncbi:MAG: DNA-protecting protein DprA [Flavobacteriales bacterium]|nr:DNA-protecting protein DprA [Flavobacteriales bacterium]